MIVIEQLSKRFQDGQSQIRVLDNLNLQIAAAEQVAITGESGSGKSTLLHLLAALDKPDAGKLLINHQALTDFSPAQADQFRRQQIGIVFQRYNLIDCLSVYDNVCFPAKLNQCYDPAHIEQLLDKLNILTLKKRLPQQLSGGEQQRVAIARALSHKPKLVLADEPTGSLDEATSDKVADLLLATCSQQQTCLVMVTHSMALAKRAHRHYHLSHHQLSLQHA